MTHQMESEYYRDENGYRWEVFQFGSCRGVWSDCQDICQIRSVVNDEPGNGDFALLMTYIEELCRRDGKHLRICEVLNQRLKRHLLQVRGFVPEGKHNVFKYFREPR